MSVAGREREQGFMLVGLIVAIFLILLALSIAAPRVAYELRREREVETVRRGNQYVRAIQLYYRKFGHYPGSIEQLEKTNNVRFLRQQYVDPMTGKADWRLIKVGEAKTTVKGFFGQPLAGLTPGLGSAAGMASAGGIGAGAAGSSPGSGAGAAGGSAFGGTSVGSPLGGASSGLGSTSPATSSGPSAGPADGSSGSAAGSGSIGSGSAASGATGSGSTGFGSSSFGSSGGIGSQSASSFSGGGSPFVGVGLVKDGDSIITLNEQTTYPTWEFIYDPRIEQMKAAAAMQNGGSSTGLSGFGSGATPSAAPGSGFGGTSNGSSPTSTSPTSPTSPSGSTGPTTGTPMPQ